MKIFSSYLKDLDPDEQEMLKRIISIVSKYVPDTQEGTSYGMPAFKYHGRPLIGFGSGKHGLSLYPFDPRVISDAREELKDFELSKGVIRFTPEQPVSKEIIMLLIDLRMDYLKKSQKSRN